jgi:guanylate kinase
LSKVEVKKGCVVVLSGPSGVGKSTICREVLDRLGDVEFSVSVTTREKSESEVEGRDYRFVSKEQFQEYLADGLFLEHAEVFGNFYGTPRDQVDQAIEAGSTIILEIDVQGAKQAKQIYPEAVMIFILPPSKKDLAERLNGRGRDGGELIEERLSGADTEIAAAWQYYEHMVINDKVEQAIEEVVAIIKEARGESNDR